VPCEVWHIDRGKPAERQDEVLMIDAGRHLPQSYPQIYDFSPEQLKQQPGALSPTRVAADPSTHGPKLDLSQAARRRSRGSGTIRMTCSPNESFVSRGARLLMMLGKTTGTSGALQLELYETVTHELQPRRSNTMSTFADNLSLPIHRWFRYSAGFSAIWARQLIEREKANGRRTVLDPFVGSGTTVIEAEAAGLPSIGIEAHPFVARIARAKLLWRTKASELRKFANAVLERGMAADRRTRSNKAPKTPKLLNQCFPPDVLSRLLSLRGAWSELHDRTPASELTWLALMAILRECSPVGTAQWQYVLPNRTKARTIDPFIAFGTKVAMFAADIERRQGLSHGPQGQVRQEDARWCQSVQTASTDLVITSPPYANNYDYADATRLEMTFAGEIDGWGDLQQSVRQYLIRSCSQHVAPISSETEEILTAPLLQPIRAEIAEVCRQLSIEREQHGGKKTYHTMVAAYFSDMARMWVSLRRVSSAGVLVCFVVGDSAPYGIYVPVDRWFGILALAAGFHSFRFEKTRDRNIKWKNRKHRVPLHEGRLWVEG